MWMFPAKSDFTPLERHQVRSLVLRDALALASIFLITVALAVATYYLFNSYSDHRKDLTARWFARGNAALQAHQPEIAIQDFHSALLYAAAPSQRPIEIALATALASAGLVQEATAYFNTLRETEPGNGEINLQLARLAELAASGPSSKGREGNQAQAKLFFHAAIYGNWEGDGYLQRRATRLELVRYLINQGDYDQARSELLVASGNAASSDLEIQSTIAALLVQDHFPADALALYRQLLAQHPESTEALKGAAATAYTLGDYLAAYRYLNRAINTPAYAAAREAPHRQADQDQLHHLNRLIVLDPSQNLPPAQLSTRLLAAREIARTRFHTCLTAQPANPALQSLTDRWIAEPKRLTASDLINAPATQASEHTLINDTEILTAQICGPPQGDDAILLRLAQVPSLSDTGLNQHE